MKATQKIIQLGKEIEKRLLVKAQAMSAQPDDIEQALRTAGLYDISNQVAPLLNAAGVPENVSLKIGIDVDPHLNVGYTVAASPNHPSAHALSRLLKMKFAPKMKSALQSAKLNVAGPMQIGWLNF